MVFSSGSAYRGLNTYFGDIHNHCDLSYGHGTLEDALSNARKQLDFASVTVHAVWPDLPTDDPNLDYLVNYHKQGFSKAQAGWEHYLERIDYANNTGEFVTFPSFEWHSLEYGDYCIYYKDGGNRPIIDAPDLPTLRGNLRDLSTAALLIPHHIGYKQGARGINWCAFEEELSPVAEIFSFHGLSESSDGPYPYLHSMGPRHEQSTAQYGWAQGNRFGVIGSTDHHNAFPGSYGYGRMGVWSESLSRDGIWNAIMQRRTYALTGDRIALAFALNDLPMGAVCTPSQDRSIDVAVTAGSTIDYIEVLHNNRIIHRENVLPSMNQDGRYKIYVEMGWAELEDAFSWDVDINIEQGKLLALEPRLRGYGPSATPVDDVFAYGHLQRQGENGINFSTHTRRNPSLHTAATEGFSIEIEGTQTTCISLEINGQAHQIELGDIMSGSRTFYTGGFVSPALCLHRAVPAQEYSHRFIMSHQSSSPYQDWYYVRVRQRNNQWAWSSPIWVEGSAS